MNKKTKTVLLMILATAINVVIVIALIFGGWLLFFSIMGNTVPKEAGYVLPAIAIIALIAGFFLYNLIWKFLCKKFDVDPDFGGKKPSLSDDDDDE